MDSEKPSTSGKLVTKKLSSTQKKKIKFKEWKKKCQAVNGKKANPWKVVLEDKEAKEMDESRVQAILTSPLVQVNSSSGVTQAVAIDCEMVGSGPRGSKDQLARVSIVNLFGHVLYDKYVKPLDPVTDYRSFVSGVYPHHLEKADEFYKVQREVCELLKGKILVGHAISHDLKVLYLSHPSTDIRDTSKYFKASVYGGKGTPSLRKLTEHHLQVNIQGACHDSVEDARATMRLYLKFKDDWESSIHSANMARYASVL